MQTLPQKIESKIERVPFSGCWIWIGAANRYGHVWFDGKVKRAHRVVYEMAKGSIPKGHSVMHVCDVGLCVNPDHLTVGTHAENMADMVAKNRQVSPCGRSHWTKSQLDRARAIGRKNIVNAHGSLEENNNAKITRETAEKIRAKYNANPFLTMSQLGSLFGIKREQTRKIVKGLAWKL